MNPPRRIVTRLAAFLEDFWKFSERTHARHSFISVMLHSNQSNRWTLNGSRRPGSEQSCPSSESDPGQSFIGNYPTKGGFINRNWRDSRVRVEVKTNDEFLLLPAERVFCISREQSWPPLR
jgi:hypothetical protein